VGDEFTEANCLFYCDIQNRLDFYYLHFILSMDLPQPPVQDLNRPPVELLVSFLVRNIRFLLKIKFFAGYALTLKSGPIGYDSIVRSAEPFLLTRWNKNMIIIVILI
jgi:hypothetical protein